MAGRKSGRGRGSEVEDVLNGRVPVTVHELIRLIHRINPTGENLDAAASAARYAEKAKLQSLLIRRFGDRLAVEPTAPDQEGLIGIRLEGFFDDDACHAVVDRLDPDARAWAEQRLAEPGSRQGNRRPGGRAGKPDPMKSAGNNPAGAARSPSLDDPLEAARQALADYEYENCETLARSALEAAETVAGRATAALLLLELFVDHLAGYGQALALAETLPAQVRADPAVKGFLALAAARSGRIEEALTLADGVPPRHLAEVYLVAGKHAVGAGEIDRVLLCIRALEDLERADLRPEIEELDRALQALRLERIAPLEQKMVEAWNAGNAKDALAMANGLLAEMPANQAARNIVQEDQDRQRRERIASLLCAADEARRSGNAQGELEFLQRAVTAGCEPETVRDRLVQAMNRVQLERQERSRGRVIELVQTGKPKEGLIAYLDLDEPQRRLIRDRFSDPHLELTEQVLAVATATATATGGRRRREELVEAVVALVESWSAFGWGDDPERILERLAPHRELLAAFPAGTTFLGRLGQFVAAARGRAAKRTLDDLCAALQTGDAVGARAACDRITLSHLLEADRPLFETAVRGLERLEALASRKKKYQSAVETADRFLARRMALEIRDLLGAGNPVGLDIPSEWQNRAEEQSRLLAKEWFLTVFELEAPPLYDVTIGIEGGETRSQGCILPERRVLVLAGSHDRWVYLRFLPIEPGGVARIAVFRTPKAMELQNVLPHGNALWLWGRTGHTVEFGLEPFEIRSWIDPSLLGIRTDICEEVLVLPAGRTMLVHRRISGDTFEMVNELFDIDGKRALPLLPGDRSPQVIHGGGRSLVMWSGFRTSVVNLYSDQGKPVERFEIAGVEAVYQGAIHPNGRDFVFASFHEPPLGFDGEEDPDDVPPLLRLETVPRKMGEYEPVVIAESDGEGEHELFPATASGLLFVIFQKMCGKTGRALAAFKDRGNRLEQVYRISIPDRFFLFSDQERRMAVALNCRGNEVLVQELGESPPVFPDWQLQPVGRPFPRFSERFFSCSSRESSNDEILEYQAFLRTATPAEIIRLIQKMRQPGAFYPKQIEALCRALKAEGRIDDADELKDWLETAHPGFIAFRLEDANAAARDERWDDVGRLLDEVPISTCEEKGKRHFGHLLGIALFRKGEMERALQVWEEAAAFGDGNCDLIPYVTYACAALGKPGNVGEELRRALDLFAAVDAACAGGAWAEAVRLIRERHALDVKDLQIQARLVDALLHLDPEPGSGAWAFKCLSLGHFVESLRDYLPPEEIFLPPTFETWSPSRIQDVADRARQWLVFSGDT